MSKDSASGTHCLARPGAGRGQLLDELQRTIRDILVRYIPADRPVALLDYPNYSNVGDSMIWLGEIAYLRSRGIVPEYVCDARGYDRDRLGGFADGKPTILLQGGGNFGTLWPVPHELRLAVLQDFPDAQIIQLPQSIHFDDPEAAGRTARIIGKHKSFTLMVRDRPSLDYASRHFDCEVVLCPDLALQLGAMQRNGRPEVDSFVLARTDLERACILATPLEDQDVGWTVERGDWLGQSRSERMLSRLVRRTAPLRHFADRRGRLLLAFWNALAQRRLARGIRLLSRGRTVITDRLHAHVLCLLLDIPHVILDNSYGKLSGFHEAWTCASNIVRTAQDMGEALAQARGLAKASA